MKVDFFFRKIDFWIIFPLFVFTFFSLVALYSMGQVKNDFSSFKKQVLFFILGFFLMFLFSFFDFQILKEHPHFFLFLYFFSLFLIIFLLLFGKSIRGVKIWYQWGPFSFDPSEILKVSLILFFAYYFSKKHVELYDIKNIFFSLLFLVLPAILLGLQPNLGAFLILFFCWGTMLLVSGIRLKEFLILSFIGIILFVLAWQKFLLPYQKARIFAFFFPHLADPLKTNWSQRQSKIAIGTAGFWGKGILGGEQKKLGFLTEPETDFIFSAIVEEMGFASALVIFLSFFTLLVRIFNLAFLNPSNFVKLFGVGVASQIFIYFFLHVSMNIGLLPVVGVSLPFLSYGGSLLLTNFILLGLLLGMTKN